MQCCLFSLYVYIRYNVVFSCCILSHSRQSGGASFRKYWAVRVCACITGTVSPCSSARVLIFSASSCKPCPGPVELFHGDGKSSQPSLIDFPVSACHASVSGSSPSAADAPCVVLDVNGGHVSNGTALVFCGPRHGEPTVLGNGADETVGSMSGDIFACSSWSVLLGSSIEHPSLLGPNSIPFNGRLFGDPFIR